MYRMPLTLVIAALLFPDVSRAELPTDKAVATPLNKIWAFRMPGTVDLEKVDDAIAIKEIQSIQRALSKPQSQNKDATAAFVVLGTGLKAIHEAREVLVEGKKPREAVPQNSEASVVFYSHKFGRYVHLDSVSRTKDKFTIRFKFVPHATKELTVHFALIPLGNCPSGQIRVEINQVPMVKAIADEEWPPVSSDIRQKIVCHSFTFECKKGEEFKSTSSQKH